MEEMKNRIVDDCGDYELNRLNELLPDGEYEQMAVEGSSEDNEERFWPAGTYVHQGSRFEVSKRALYRRTEYRVRLLEGSWPSDKDLVALCDSDFASTRVSHWGGGARDLTDNVKEVVVYID